MRLEYTEKKGRTFAGGFGVDAGWTGEVDEGLGARLLTTGFFRVVEDAAPATRSTKTKGTVVPDDGAGGGE